MVSVCNDRNVKSSNETSLLLILIDIYSYLTPFGPLTHPILPWENRVYGTVASSPRAVTDRLLGCACRPEDRTNEAPWNRFDVRFFVLYSVRPRYGTHEYRLGSRLQRLPQLRGRSGR